MNQYNLTTKQIHTQSSQLKNFSKPATKKLREIIEDSHEIDSLIKNKIMKKKEKIKSNLMNFSNPVNVLGGTGYYKLHLETSQAFNPSLFKAIEEKKSQITPQLHKRSNSTYEDETPPSYKDELKRSLVSPRLEKLISKYGEFFEKKDFKNEPAIISNKVSHFNNTGSFVLKNPPLAIQQKDCDSFRETGLNLKSSAFKPSNYSKTITTSKTTAGTKQNSRKNSLDKIVFKNAINVKDLKISTNSSSNNSTLTLLSGKCIDRGENCVNNTETSKNIVGHSKMLSDIPVLSSVNMNLLSYYKKESVVKSMKEIKSLISVSKKIDTTNQIKKKVPLPNAKKNSMGRIEDFATAPPKETIPGSALSKSKYIPITTSHSPSHIFTKDLMSNFKEKSSTPISPKSKSKFSKKEIVMKNLDLGSINQHFNEHTKQTIPTFDTRLEKILDNSTDSIRSTMRERDFYRRESDKIVHFVKQCKYFFI